MSTDTVCTVIFACAAFICCALDNEEKESPVIEQEGKFSLANYRTPYEQYCDSIREADPDYYYDVLVETDEFQENYHVTD